MGQTFFLLVMMLGDLQFLWSYFAPFFTPHHHLAELLNKIATAVPLWVGINL